MATSSILSTKKKANNFLFQFKRELEQLFNGFLIDFTIQVTKLAQNCPTSGHKISRDDELCFRPQTHVHILLAARSTDMIINDSSASYRFLAPQTMWDFRFVH
jgi:hypothetical protein